LPSRTVVRTTMRSARSRTSGENLMDLFNAPFSQELELRTHGGQEMIPQDL
jgi:hypothetical protein